MALDAKRRMNPLGRACGLVVAVGLASMACGGTVSAPSGGGNDAGTDTRPSCPSIPKEPVYACPPRPRQADDCPPWNDRDEASQTGYPQNCSVAIPQPSVFSNGCGPQRCNCSTYPGPNGTTVVGWVCPV